MTGDEHSPERDPVGRLDPAYCCSTTLSIQSIYVEKYVICSTSMQMSVLSRDAEQPFQTSKCRSLLKVHAIFINLWILGEASPSMLFNTNNSHPDLSKHRILDL